MKQKKPHKNKSVNGYNIYFFPIPQFGKFHNGKEIMIMTVQTCFPEIKQEKLAVPLKQQLLKWISNKQRFVREIVSFFPEHYETYHEPFLGSGAVLGTLNPAQAYASDIFEPLMGIWKTLSHSPELLKRWYSQRWQKTFGK